MPTLSWINDTQARQEASKVPFHLLEKVDSYGDQASENILVQGDNLLALKALLPFYRGKVKCIYIDPPYNTGSAFEHYDDNLEHSQWLSLMFPRLQLLADFLTDDGVIFISIDDDECHYVKILCDEIFGRQNFCGSFIWVKKRKPSYLSKFGVTTEYILSYAKNKKQSPDFALPEISNETYPLYNANNPRTILTLPPGSVQINFLQKGKIQPAVFKEKTSLVRLINEIEVENHRNVNAIQIEGEWRYSQETINEQVAQGDYYIIKSKKFRPRRYFVRNDETKKKVQNLLCANTYQISTNEDATEEGHALFGVDKSFDYPKPEKLISFLLSLVLKPNDLVLDSFLGSGTTAAVAHKMGYRYIGIEMGEHARTHCIPRLEKVIDGEQGGISKSIHWQGGGGFSFYKLGENVFDEMGSINPKVDFKTLAAYIWQKETSTPSECQFSPLLGEYQGKSIFLLYNGILGDKRPRAGNVLNRTVLKQLLKKYPSDNEKIVYGDACFGISKEELRANKVTFKQIPYDLGM